MSVYTEFIEYEARRERDRLLAEEVERRHRIRYGSPFANPYVSYPIFNVSCEFEETSKVTNWKKRLMR